MVAVEAERLGRGLDPRHVAVVVLAPDEDDALVAAAELLDEVADVGREVGGRGVVGRAQDDAILVVAVPGRSEDDRAVLLVDVAGGPQSIDRLRDPAVVVERALRAPDVEMAAEVLEAGLDAGSNLLGRPPADRPGGVLARLLGPGQDFGRDLARHVVDVVAVVAVLGDLAAFADGHDRRAQVLDLAAEVVEVVLARDGVAGGRQDPAQEVAGEGAAGIADVERPGGVGRDELDVDALRMRGNGAAPGGRIEQDVLRRGRQSVVGEADVEESGRRDLHRGDGRGRGPWR